MSKDNRRTFKNKEDKDVILRGAVVLAVILIVIGAAVIAAKLFNPLADTDAGVEKLKQLNKADVAAVDARIQELEKAEREADEAWQNRPANEKFADSLVLGDSISQGLYEFEILDQSHVIANRGAEVTRAEDTGTMEAITNAKDANPRNLFLAYGMNDIEGAYGDAGAFTGSYKILLDKIREELPDTKIYVNGILPVQQKVIDANEWYANIPEYNSRLKELCESEGIVFIDNSDLVKEEYYTEDGIHLSPDYYPGWADRMAEAAEL